MASFFGKEIKMARFCTLCSSSSGNSTYIGTRAGGILVDAGTNAKRLIMAMQNVNVAPESIKAIFVTHEHNDHIGALRVFANKYKVPVLATKGTLSALEKTGHLNGDFESIVIPENGFEVCGMEVRSVRTSHDSAESCGYTVTMPDERRISVITDTGVITRDIVDKVTGSDLILLESNHDKLMLDIGPYPYYLKKRILSSEGHLSNDDCAKAACHFINTGTTRLVLGHLSRENNTPFKAFEKTNEALGEMGAVAGIDYDLQVAPPGVGERMVIF